MKFISSLILLFSAAIYGQELIGSISLNLKAQTDVYQVIEEDKNQISLFFSDKQNESIIRLNEKFALKDSLVSKRPSSQFDANIGYSISGEKYYSYWLDFKKGTVAQQCFDFSTKKVVPTYFELNFEQEKTFKKLTLGHLFYLFTISKESSMVNCYVFDNGKMEKKTIDLTRLAFLDSKSRKTDFWTLLKWSSQVEDGFTVQDILHETPPSLVFGANKRKSYLIGHELVFTFDNSTNFTQLLRINLNDFSASQKLISQPYIDTTKFENPTSNSFLYQNTLIQLKSNPEQVQISMKDIDGNEFKNYTLYLDQEFPFKNSTIIEENGSVKKRAVVEKPNQLIRKIANLNPSLSCYVENNELHLTVGAVSEVKNNDSFVSGGLIGGLAGSLAFGLASQFSIQNINSYHRRYVIYTNCLFDSAFNYLKIEQGEQPFDRLRNFIEEHSMLSDQTVFNYKSDLYIGAYQLSKKKYSFYKF